MLGNNDNIQLHTSSSSSAPESIKIYKSFFNQRKSFVIPVRDLRAGSEAQ